MKQMSIWGDQQSLWSSIYSPWGRNPHFIFFFIFFYYLRISCMYSLYFHHIHVPISSPQFFSSSFLPSSSSFYSSSSSVIPPPSSFNNQLLVFKTIANQIHMSVMSSTRAWSGQYPTLQHPLTDNSFLTRTPTMPSLHLCSNIHWFGLHQVFCRQWQLLDIHFYLCVSMSLLMQYINLCSLKIWSCKLDDVPICHMDINYISINQI